MLDNVVRFLSLSDAYVRFVLLGALLIGATGGLLGSFAVLRKRSLVGDALAHAALPGCACSGTASLFLRPPAAEGGGGGGGGHGGGGGGGRGGRHRRPRRAARRVARRDRGGRG